MVEEAADHVRNHTKFQEFVEETEEDPSQTEEYPSQLDSETEDARKEEIINETETAVRDNPEEKLGSEIDVEHLEVRDKHDVDDHKLTSNQHVNAEQDTDNPDEKLRSDDVKESDTDELHQHDEL